MTTQTIENTLARIAPFLCADVRRRMAESINAEIERQDSFLYRLLKAMLDDGNYRLQVRYDGGTEEHPLPITDSIDDIYAAALDREDCHLYVYDYLDSPDGWIYLVWDDFNPGCENQLVNDYTVWHEWNRRIEDLSAAWEI